MDAYWRAANYLSVGQIYLLDNPLLRVPLEAKHVKPRLLGHWGTSPGLNLIYVHLNRLIREHDLNAIYITGPGHGGPALVANVYLEGTYTEVYPHVTRDEAGLKKLFRQFSFPGGIPSHVAPETPGLDPRRRRARLLPESRRRRRPRQSGSSRRLRHRRRRGRDRSARDGVALQQVPQSRSRRSGPAHPPPQRLQDRESDDLRAHPPRRARAVHAGLRMGSALRGRKRARRTCTARWPPPWTCASAESERSRRRRERDGDPAARAGP